jgi:hypothetical protein
MPKTRKLNDEFSCFRLLKRLQRAGMVGRTRKAFVVSQWLVVANRQAGACKAARYRDGISRERPRTRTVAVDLIISADFGATLWSIYGQKLFFRGKKAYS